MVAAIDPPIDEQRFGGEGGGGVAVFPRSWGGGSWYSRGSGGGALPVGVPRPNPPLPWSLLSIRSKREADTEFKYRHRIVDTDTIADAVSQTSRNQAWGLASGKSLEVAASPATYQLP